MAGFTRDLREKYGLKIVGSIDELLSDVDVVLLESVDGRPHLEQARPVLKAHKPVFIDKPLAGSLSDAIAIFELARETNTPCFSSSSVRFSEGIDAVLQNAKLGEIVGCDIYGPCSLEEHHPDLFWYGIHGVEGLFKILGMDCQSVSRTQTKKSELVVGVWSGDRVGTYRGVKRQWGPYQFGGTVFGTKGNTRGRCRKRRWLWAHDGRGRQILRDWQASGQHGGDAGDLCVHGSRRREQAPRGQAGDSRKRHEQGQASSPSSAPLTGVGQLRLRPGWIRAAREPKLR